MSEELVATALSAARQAARVHRAHLGRVTVSQWSKKGIADFVSHVDREAETGIVAAIRHRFPAHRVLAEEEAGERGAGSGVSLEWSAPEEWTWVVDPLDGTTNYLHGYPMYAVSIGVLRGDVLVAGVVVNSATGEEWTATRGGGSFRNGEVVRVSPIDSLQHALIGTGFPFREPALLPRYTRQLEAVLGETSGVRRAGSAALDLCHVASGWLDAFWELTLAPWDIAAGTLLIREAGGVVTTLDGDEDVVRHGSVLAGNRLLHRPLGKLVRDAATGGSGRGDEHEDVNS